MTVTDWTAIIALLVASCALTLEVHRWLESGPRLNLTVMTDAILVPGNDGKPRLALTVRNRGTVATTLTHMVAYGFESRWHKFRKKPNFAAIVKEPNLPHELGVNQAWIGTAIYDEEITALRIKGQLYIGVASIHTDRNYLIPVSPPRVSNLPAKTIG